MVDLLGVPPGPSSLPHLPTPSPSSWVASSKPSMGMAGPLEASSRPSWHSSSPPFSPLASPSKVVDAKSLAQSSYPLLKRNEILQSPAPDASFLVCLKSMDLRNGPLFPQHAKSPGPAEKVATEQSHLGPQSVDISSSPAAVFISARLSSRDVQSNSAPSVAIGPEDGFGKPSSDVLCLSLSQPPVHRTEALPS